MKLRKIQLLTFISLLAITFLTSCNKNNLESEQISNDGIELRSSDNVLNPTTTYIHNGVAKMGNQITETETMNVIIGYNGDNYVFDNDQALHLWTYSDSDRFRMREVLDSINYLQTFQNMPGGEDEVIEKLPFGGWLFEDYDMKGKMWGIKGVTYGKYNKKASSYLIILGGAVLCDKTWWRGKKIWLLGLPGTWNNLNNPPFYFDDRAQSGWDI